MRVNDIGFRLVLVPFFGILIPLVNKPGGPCILPSLENQIELSLHYRFIIGDMGRQPLSSFTLRTYFNWFNQPMRKVIVLVLAASFFTIPVSVLLLITWYQLFQEGKVNWDVVTESTLVIMISVLFIVHVYETVFLVKESESRNGEECTTGTGQGRS